jgi:glycosyltransferase involved in cell wall biosynthesis
MRIIQLTPGTGSFYCGTCLRDNALVVELRRRGHDALMVPMYLPPALDEAPASEGAPVLYGGVNVYLQQKSALFRKTPRWVDQLFDSPRVLRSAAKRAGMTQPSDLGDLQLSTLRGEEGNQLKELERLCDWLEQDRHPEVVSLSNALLVGLARRIKQRTGAKVVCTLQGEDSFLDGLMEPHRTQCWQILAERVRDVDAFISVSDYYGGVMRRRANIPDDRVHTVYNGILLDGYTPAAAPPDPPVIGYLARMCPPKGLHTLVEAYLLLRKRGTIPGLKLSVVGTCTAADEAFVAELKVRLAAAGLLKNAEFLPNVDRETKIRRLQGMSVLSVPATYGEAFGLYLVEAWAAGVPVVQPRDAAFPELRELTGGGLLCRPDDPASLAEKLEELLRDPVHARTLGERAREIVLERFSVARMAADVERVLEHVTGGVCRAAS